METETQATRDISVSDDSDDQSWHSPFNSTPGESCCQIRLSGEIDGEANPRRGSSASECSLEIDLEKGDLEMKEHLGKLRRDCRICQLELAENGEVDEPSTTMELGCSCKGDLGAAHKHCAETWFKIRGNTICEICGTTALNIANDQIHEVNSVNAATTSSDSAAPAAIVMENQTCWQGRRLMNFMFTCMLVGFAVSWLFHFKLIS